MCEHIHASIYKVYYKCTMWCTCPLTNLSSAKCQWGDSDGCLLVEPCLGPPLTQLWRSERTGAVGFNGGRTAKCTGSEEG